MYCIYCPYTNCIVSRSNICSTDPLRGGVVNKTLDPDDPSLNSKDSDKLLPPLLDSGKKMKEQQDSGEHVDMKHQVSKDSGEKQDSREHREKRI